MQRVKALNYTVDEFPIFTEENSGRYEAIRKELANDLMFRTILRLSHRNWKTNPVLKKKMEEMMRRHREFVMKCCEETFTMDRYKFIHGNPTAQEVINKHE